MFPAHWFYTNLIKAKIVGKTFVAEYSHKRGYYCDAFFVDLQF